MKVKSTDIMRKCVSVGQADYIIERHQSQLSPEDLLIEAETAMLAGEDFETPIISGYDLGYNAPATADEFLEAMCRRRAVSEEENILCGIEKENPRKVENKYKRKVRRRKGIIAEELPRKRRFYDSVQN